MTVPRFLGEGCIDWADVPVPEPGAGELLIRVGANALCGTERLQYRFGARVTPGHEAAGEVVAVGPDTTVPVGARGAVYLMEYCGTCRSCAGGHTNQCLHKARDFGFTVDGGYAPFELVSERCFFPVGNDLPLDEATMLLDVMGTSAHAFGRARLIHDDIESILIKGAGPIGLGLVAMAPLVLGDGVKVFVADMAPYRLSLCEELGAVPINIGTDEVAGVLADHGLDRVDAAFEAAGKADARRTGLDALGKRGVLVCVGHGQGLEIKVSPDLIAPERGILGSEYFRYDELAPNLDLLMANRDRLRRIITHRFPLKNIGEAFETFVAGETGKVVIEP